MLHGLLYKKLLLFWLQNQYSVPSGETLSSIIGLIRPNDQREKIRVVTTALFHQRLVKFAAHFEIIIQRFAEISVTIVSLTTSTVLWSDPYEPS